MLKCNLIELSKWLIPANTIIFWFGEVPKLVVGYGNSNKSESVLLK